MRKRSGGDVRGIDVSHRQGEPDWARVRGSGAAFAFLKATDGASAKDRALLRNAAAARKHGLAVGFYHCARPERNGPNAELLHFTETVRGMESELPHVLHMEGRAAELGADALTRWAGAWLEGVAAMTGKPVMLYAPASFAGRYFGRALARYPLWVAQYETVRPMANKVWNDWTVVQFSDRGNVPGIAGPVGLNAMKTDAFATYTAPDAVTVHVGAGGTVTGRLIRDRAWVPVRAAGEALGGTVGWAGRAATVNGKALDTKLIGADACVPILQLAAALKVPVGWDLSTRSAFLGNQ